MLQIYLNGEEKQIPEELDMAGLIELLELTGQRIAVEVNEELVPRSTFAGHRLKADDRVEIIHAVGGG
jgi:sulfur carrier protein